MIKKPTDLSFIKHADQMDIFLLAGSRILGALVQGTQMVNEMQANHELGIIETLALGHAYLAASLLTRSLSGDERIAIHVDSSGPLGGLVVEANTRGHVRGYLLKKGIELVDPVDSFDLAPFIGIGFLKITKYLEDLKQPFTGQVVLQTSNMAEDLVYYFHASEQIPTAIKLSIKFDKQGRVTGAGGLLLQALPEADPQILTKLTEDINAFPSLGKLFEEGQTCTSILTEYFTPYDLELLAHNPVQFHCHCSRERFSDFLKSLPQAELEDIMEKGPFPVVATCHNCNSAYEYTKEDIEHIAQR